MRFTTAAVDVTDPAEAWNVAHQRAGAWILAGFDEDGPVIAGHPGPAGKRGLTRLDKVENQEATRAQRRGCGTEESFQAAICGAGIVVIRERLADGEYRVARGKIDFINRGFDKAGAAPRASTPNPAAWI